MEEGRQLAESQVKAITGGDRISARFLHSQPIEFDPVLKLWLCGNSKPIVRGQDHGIWRRVMLIPFEHTVAEDKRDPHLVDKLRGESSGIMNWLITGAHIWKTCGGLRPPAKVLMATKEYKDESFVLADFVDMRCDVGQLYEVDLDSIYANYKTWCETSGERPIPRRWFGRRLIERGFHKVRTTGGRKVYRGLRVKNA